MIDRTPLQRKKAEPSPVTPSPLVAQASAAAAPGVAPLLASAGPLGGEAMQSAPEQMSGAENESRAERALGHAIDRISIWRPAGGLRVSLPDEPPEREADRAADAALRGGEPQAALAGDRPRALQGMPRAVDGSGAPLDAPTRAFMEARLGHDFSQVRVHTDTRADERARAVQARAFTVGQDVVFAAGEYAPGATDGRRLLAHELTHVVQQSSGVARQIQRQPAEPKVTADPNLIPLPPSRTKMDMTERNWMKEIAPAAPPAKLTKLELNIGGSVPAAPFDIDTGWTVEGPDPIGMQRITRTMAWTTMRADLTRLEEGFNAMIEPHNMFHAAQEDPSLKKVAIHMQLPAPTQKATLPQVAGKQHLGGAPEGQTLDSAFSGGKLAKPGDAKALEEMAKSPEILAAHNDLKVKATDLEAKVGHAKAAATKMNSAALEVKAVTLRCQVEEAKEQTAEYKAKLEELGKKKAEAAKFAEGLIDITQNLLRSLAGDAKAGEKVVEGAIKMAIGAVAEEIAGQLYKSQIDAATAGLATSTIELKKLTKESQQAEVAAAQSKVSTAKQEFEAAKLDIATSLQAWRAAVAKLGATMAASTTGATDPEERKRIAGLIEALPVVELVASRAAQLRMVGMKAQQIPYTMASGIGFGMLTWHEPPKAQKFLTSCGLLVGVSQDALAAEDQWKERAKSIQAMIEQIGQAPALPGIPTGGGAAP